MYYENVKGVLSSGFGMLYGCRPLQPELVSAVIRCGPMNGFRRTCRSSIPILGVSIEVSHSTLDRRFEIGGLWGIACPSASIGCS